MQILNSSSREFSSTTVVIVIRMHLLIFSLSLSGWKIIAHTEWMGGKRGGSRQISLSYDKSITFKVIKSFIGSCPNATEPVQIEPNPYFTIPKEAPTGEAPLQSTVFWSWEFAANINHMSWFNRGWEMYQNCAVIHVQRGGTGISSLQDMLVANFGSDYLALDTQRYVQFSDPGTNVVYGDWDRKIEYPSGPNCGPTKDMAKIGDTITLKDTVVSSIPTETSTTASPTLKTLTQSMVASLVVLASTSTPASPTSPTSSAAPWAMTIRYLDFTP